MSSIQPSSPQGNEQVISDQAARDRVVSELGVSLVVDAGAGTGKTHLLIDRLMATLLTEGIPLSQIAAITFTDKAAGELLERLRSRLEEEREKAAGGPREVLVRHAIQDLEQASICTIHSFCSSILREYPVAAGVDPLFSVLDQVQAEALENQAWETWLKQSLAKRVESLDVFLKLGGTFEQVEALKGHLLRNRSLLTEPDVPPRPDAAPVFLKIQGILEEAFSLLPHCGDPEDRMASALRKLQGEWKACRETAPEGHFFALADLEFPGHKKGNKGNWAGTTLNKVRELLAGAEEIREAFSAQAGDWALRSVGLWLWGYLKAQDAAKVRQGFLDFDDLLSRTRNLLQGSPAVRENLKERYGRLFVDEFQDTDPLQVEIVFFLSEKKEGPKPAASAWKEVELEPGKLFLVGDPQQSIYRFRRADVEIYREAKAKLEEAGGRVEKLTENFRTIPPLVEWVNGSFTKIFQEGVFQHTPQRAHRRGPDGEKALPPLVGLEVPDFPDAEDGAAAFREMEAEAVASFIAGVLGAGYDMEDPQVPGTRRPLEAGDIAILFRELSNSEEVYEEALRRWEIPFQIVGGKKFFNRPEVAALETLLAALESPADETATAALLRSPLFGFKDEELFLHRAKGGEFRFLGEAGGSLGEAFTFLRKWHAETRNLSPSEALQYLYDRTNLLPVAASQPHGEQRVANLLKVLGQCRDLESSRNFTARAFLRWLSRRREEDDLEGEAPGPGGKWVTLMTLHKAKGLEFPVVILSGEGRAKPKTPEFLLNRTNGKAEFKLGAEELELRTSGYRKAKAEELSQELAENLRLLYVGCTRARESLVLPLSPRQKAGAFLKPLREQLCLESLQKIKPKPDGRGTETGASGLQWKEGAPNHPDVEDWERKLRGMEEERKALVGQREGKELFQSVTSLAHAGDDKAWRESLSLEGEIPLTGSQAHAKAFGVLVHKLLEKGWDWDAGKMGKAARLWALEEGLPREDADEAASLAVRALGGGLLERAKRASRVFRELPLTGKGEGGLLLNAVVDLAFLEEGEWVLVDYKTDREVKGNLGPYQEQLRHYGRLLGSLTGIKVRESALYFLRLDRVETVK